MTLTFGYTTEGVCTGLAFLEIKETPGIGMKADEPDFKNQFVNKKAEQFISVKNGASADNEINAIIFPIIIYVILTIFLKIYYINILTFSVFVFSNTQTIALVLLIHLLCYYVLILFL